MVNRRKRAEGVKRAGFKAELEATGWKEEGAEVEGSDSNTRVSDTARRRTRWGIPIAMTEEGLAVEAEAEMGDWAATVMRRFT